VNIGLDASTLLASVKREGEKYHIGASGLAAETRSKGIRGVCSGLVLIEVPGALSSATTMPIEKIYETFASLLASFSIEMMPFESQVERATELMLEFRDLKRLAGIGSADFHYLAAAYNQGCDMFVTTDERHLLRSDVKKGLSKYLEIVNPEEALAKLKV
jgi:predicted nucleic acid-binding protein